MCITCCLSKEQWSNEQLGIRSLVSLYLLPWQQQHGSCSQARGKSPPNVHVFKRAVCCSTRKSFDNLHFHFCSFTRRIHRLIVFPDLLHPAARGQERAPLICGLSLQGCWVEISDPAVLSVHQLSSAALRAAAPRRVFR